MTPLARLLIAQIEATGPITLADYMAACLSHPEHGYYVTRDPLGAAGDFTTAPEISQMFGELLGLSLAQAWLDQGAPNRITLAELGPGRGTLMQDVLRATRAIPKFHGAISLHLVESSPALRAEQERRLGPAEPQWHDTVDTLPDAPLFLVANEFFDSLPIRQFQREGRGWRETVVGVRDGQLVAGRTEPIPLQALAHRLPDTADGDIVETNAPASAVAASIGARIAEFGGAALIADYGDWRSKGDTFQAVRDHETTDPFDQPGAADLTAHVDFEAIAEAAAPAAHAPMTLQGVFLEQLGITPRAQALARGLQGEALASHIAAHRRLTHPDEMGSLFKILALHPHAAPPPPGVSS